jgi:uncharacterized membrane protein YphA (DoxX/SURF4 family)
VANPNRIDEVGASEFQPAPDVPQAPRIGAPDAEWSPALRVAFRFCFAYFTLYALSNQILGGLIVVPGVDLPDLGTVWPLRQIAFWAARHVFRVTRTLVYTGSGSGDKTFDWVQAFCLLVFAVMIAGIWSRLDRRRPNYVTLHKWLRLFMRFALGSEMLIYGFIKIIPNQMPFPNLDRLIEPFGNFSPMAVLWSSVGASPAYEMFAGSAEALGGILLIIPRTATLGALVCLADLAQVFVLNMTYDVPVKLLSFHLILASLFLLAPEARRIRDLFLSDRAVAASTQPRLFRTWRANRAALGLQLLFGLYLIGMNILGGIRERRTYGEARPKPTLYGIWNVEQMSIDGQIRPPLLTDSDRWRRVIFDFTSFASFEHMDESYAGFSSSISDKDKTLTLTKGGDKNWKSMLTFNRPAPDRLILDGSMSGHQVHIELKLLDRSKLTLVSRGFHWINEYPYHR